MVNSRYVCVDCGIEVPENEIISGPNHSDSGNSNEPKDKVYSESVDSTEKVLFDNSSNETKNNLPTDVNNQNKLEPTSVSNNRTKSVSKSMDDVVKNVGKVSWEKNKQIYGAQPNKILNESYSLANNDFTQNMSSQSSDNNIEQKEVSNVETKDSYEVIEKFAIKPKDSYDTVANFSDKPVEMVSEKNDSSDIYRNPIFDEKLPDIQTTNKKAKTNEPNTINKFVSVIILGGLLLLGLIAGGGFFYYKLSRSANSLVSTTTTTIAEAEWIEYIAPENKYVMLFPAEADVTQSTVSLSETATVDVTYVSASSSTTSYLLQSSTIPDSIDISNPEEFYQGILSGMLGENNNGEIVSNTKTEFLGGEGLEYLIKIDDKYTKGKIILIGRDWYLSAVNSDTKTPVDYSKFVDSLTLSKGE